MVPAAGASVEEPRGGSKVILRMDAVVGGYGATTVLHETSFEVYRNALTTIIGPNGAGKSTAIKAIFGILRVRSGHVWYDDDDIVGHLWRLAALIGRYDKFAADEAAAAIAAATAVVGATAQTEAPTGESEEIAVELDDAEADVTPAPVSAEAADADADVVATGDADVVAAADADDADTNQATPPPVTSALRKPSSPVHGSG